MEKLIEQNSTYHAKLPNTGKFHYLLLFSNFLQVLKNKSFWREFCKFICKNNFKFVFNCWYATPNIILKPHIKIVVARYCLAIKDENCPAAQIHVDQSFIRTRHHGV